MMHDVAYFESQGIPAVAVVSEEFRSQAVYQGRSLGLAENASLTKKVFLRHPISDQTRTQLYAKADEVFGDVVRGLFVEGAGDGRGAAAAEEEAGEADDAIMGETVGDCGT